MNTYRKVSPWHSMNKTRKTVKYYSNMMKFKNRKKGNEKIRLHCSHQYECTKRTNFPLYSRSCVFFVPYVLMQYMQFIFLLKK